MSCHPWMSTAGRSNQLRKAPPGDYRFLMFPIPYLGQTIDNAHSSWAGKRNGCGGEAAISRPHPRVGNTSS